MSATKPTQLSIHFIESKFEKLLSCFDNDSVDDPYNTFECESNTKITEKLQKYFVDSVEDQSQTMLDDFLQNFDTFVERCLKQFLPMRVAFISSVFLKSVATAKSSSSPSLDNKLQECCENFFNGLMTLRRFVNFIFTGIPRTELEMSFLSQFDKNSKSSSAIVKFENKFVSKMFKSNTIKSNLDRLLASRDFVDENILSRFNKVEVIDRILNKRKRWSPISHIGLLILFFKWMDKDVPDEIFESIKNLFKESAKRINSYFIYAYDLLELTNNEISKVFTDKGISFSQFQADNTVTQTASINMKLDNDHSFIIKAVEINDEDNEVLKLQKIIVLFQPSKVDISSEAFIKAAAINNFQLMENIFPDDGKLYFKNNDIDMKHIYQYAIGEGFIEINNISTRDFAFFDLKKFNIGLFERRVLIDKSNFEIYLYLMSLTITLLYQNLLQLTDDTGSYLESPKINTLMNLIADKLAEEITKLKISTDIIKLSTQNYDIKSYDEDRESFLSQQREAKDIISSEQTNIRKQITRAQCSIFNLIKYEDGDTEQFSAVLKTPQELDKQFYKVYQARDNQTKILEENVAKSLRNYFNKSMKPIERKMMIDSYAERFSDPKTRSKRFKENFVFQQSRKTSRKRSFTENFSKLSFGNNKKRKIQNKNTYIVESVLGHRGERFEDVELDIRWEDGSTTTEVFSKNVTIRRNLIVLDYLRKNSLDLLIDDLYRDKKINKIIDYRPKDNNTTTFNSNVDLLLGFSNSADEEWYKYCDDLVSMDIMKCFCSKNADLQSIWKNTFESPEILEDLFIEEKNGIINKLEEFAINTAIIETIKIALNISDRAKIDKILKVSPCFSLGISQIYDILDNPNHDTNYQQKVEEAKLYFRSDFIKISNEEQAIAKNIPFDTFIIQNALVTDYSMSKEMNGAIISLENLQNFIKANHVNKNLKDGYPFFLDSLILISNALAYENNYSVYTLPYNFAIEEVS